MNLALQKRHEQLERWRQNEAELEQEEEEQQQQQQQQQQQEQSLGKQQATAPENQFGTRTRPGPAVSGRGLGASNSSDDSKAAAATTATTTKKSNFILRQLKSVPLQGNISTSIDDADDRSSPRQATSERPLISNISSPAGRAQSTTTFNATNTTRLSASASKTKPKTRTQITGQENQSRTARVKFTNSTLFLNACAQGDLDECTRLLDGRQVDINTTTCDGLTGLHEAAICGNVALTEFLLKRGANINCCDHEGWTPLHAAASLGQNEIVELLLARGANVTIVNCENFLAYDLARNDQVRALIGAHLEGQDVDLLRRQEELLIEQDLDRWLQTGKYVERTHPITQASVLHVMAAKGYVNLMKRLLNAPAQYRKQIDLEARDHEGYTPLLAASFWNQTDIVEMLIEAGANIFAQSNSGYKISSIHLKTYQDRKLSQPQQTLTSRTGNATTTTTAARSSLQSIDSDNASRSATNRSTTSLESSRSSIDYDDERETDSQSIGDHIPSGSARHLRSGATSGTNAGLLSKSKSLDIGDRSNQQQQESPILFSTMSVDRLLLRADSMGERDLRKSFKELVMENERLKQQLKGLDDKDKQRQQDWIRRERQMHRKISELEEENKQIEHWKQEIQRLKDENNSLIRVVSKLSKQH